MDDARPDEPSLIGSMSPTEPLEATMYGTHGWHDGMGDGWWWPFMALMMVAFWGGLAWLLITLIRHGGGGAGSADSATLQPRQPSPEEIIQERFARGEIDADEYHHRLDVLRSSRGASS